MDVRICESMLKICDRLGPKGVPASDDDDDDADDGEDEDEDEDDDEDEEEAPPCADEPASL